MAQDSGATAKSAPPSMLATCRQCGDVVIKVGLSQVLRSGSGSGWYSFDCPMCGHGVRQAAPEHLLSLLTCLGATCAEATGAAAADEPAAPAPPAQDDRPLTLDDLIALKAALASTADVVAYALKA